MANLLAQWLSGNLEEFQRNRALSMKPRGNLDLEAFEARRDQVIAAYEKLFKDLESLCDESLRTERHLMLLFILLFINTDLYIKNDNLTLAKETISKLIHFLHQLPLGLIVKSYDCTEPSNDLAIDIEPRQDNDPFRAAFALILIEFYNNLGLLKQALENDLASIVYLIEAENIFKHWEKQEPRVYTLTYDDLFEIDPNIKTLQEMVDAVKTKEVEKKEIEISYIHTTSYLAGAYQRAQQFDDSSRYAHLSLRLQLPYIGKSRQVPDCVDWALNAATLSQYFINNGYEFNVARHMICCARRILFFMTTENQKARESERFRQTLAHIDRIEVLYCIQLLDSSIELINKSQIDQYKDNTYQFKSYLLKDDELPEMEQKMSQFPARDYEQAKVVLLQAMTTIEQAKNFFTLDERCSDYIGCVLDQCEIYRAFAFFEKDTGNRCKLLKRRIDLLERLIKELNPQYFLAHCRKIRYELSDLYSQLMAIKLMQYGDEKNRKQYNKLNNLATQCIINHYKFIISFSCIASKPPKEVSDLSQVEFYSLPKRLEETGNYITSILTSYAAIGKTYSVMLAFTPQEAWKNWSIAKRYYEEVQSYVHRNEDHCREYFNTYWPTIEEMIKLIPIKMERIAEEIQAFGNC